MEGSSFIRTNQIDAELTVEEPMKTSSISLLVAFFVFPLLPFSCGKDLEREPDEVTYFPAGCDTLFLNLHEGLVNGLYPTAPQELIKYKMPCFSGSTDDSSEYNCGGGVFYQRQDLFFYTFRNYLEVGKGFPGKTSYPRFFNYKKPQVEALLGKPSESPTPDIYLYDMEYGCLRVHFAIQDVNYVGIHLVPCSAIDYCEN